MTPYRAKGWMNIMAISSNPMVAARGRRIRDALRAESERDEYLLSRSPGFYLKRKKTSRATKTYDPTTH